MTHRCARTGDTDDSHLLALETRNAALLALAHPRLPKVVHRAAADAGKPSVYIRLAELREEAGDGDGAERLRRIELK
jgi:hypothetical protein